MQGLLDPPRQNFTRQNLLDVLGWAPSVHWDTGYELLDSNDNPVADLSPYLVRSGSWVERNCTADVQGTALLNTEYPHNWGTDRVRPYYLLGCDSVPLGPVRFDLGVYVLTTPGQPLDTMTPVYGATGFDKNYLLNRPLGDAYSVPAGTAYIAAAKAAILAAGGGSHVIIDNTKAASTLPTALNWSVQDGESVTWLAVVNQLLKAISYRPLWCDQNGYYRSEPDVDPATRPSEFILSAGDTTVARFVDRRWHEHVIVGPTGRALQRDNWNTPNWWRFIQGGLTFAPTEGNGQYTVQNVSAGPTSQQAVGRVIKAPVRTLTASGQTDLAAQGDQIVAQTLATVEAVSFPTAPLPIAGHFDVLTYADPALPGADNRRVVAQSWHLPLDGGDMNWTTHIAQVVDDGLWVGASVPTRPPSYDPPPNLGWIYHPVTPAGR